MEDTYHVVMVAEESHGYPLTLDELNLPENAHYVSFFYHNGTLSLPALAPFDRASPLPLNPNPLKDTFTVFYMAPVLANGLVMLGETSKWVPVSHGRVPWMTVGEESVVLGLIGGPMEQVTWSWAMPESGSDWMVMHVTCTLNEEGRAKLTLNVDMTTACSLL